MASYVSRNKKLDKRETIEQTENFACILCEEVVPQKKSLTGKRFGILDNCNHIFCTDCIQNHIKSNIELNIQKHKYQGEELLKRSIICPHCEMYSTVVMVCKKRQLDVEEKKVYKKEFDECLSNIPCPFAKRGIHNCFCETKHDLKFCVFLVYHIPHNSE